MGMSKAWLDEKVLKTIKPGYGWTPWGMAACIKVAEADATASFARLVRSGRLRKGDGSIHYLATTSAG